jgi:hypothetical protein
MTARIGIVVAALALALGSVACADTSTSSPGGATSTGPTTSPGPNTPKPTKTTASPVIDVPEPLDFEAELLGGGTFRGADLAGKDVAFWIWAPW